VKDVDRIGEIEKSIKALAKEVRDKIRKPIDIQFSWPMDHELMRGVNEIRELLKKLLEKQQGESNDTNTP